MTEANRRRRALTCVALSALLLIVAAVGTVDAGTIWIEWDRSPDPTVAGYRVSVGTSPGVYTQTFDVGSATSFVYQAQDARLYYLAVASYAAGPLVGPLSGPLSAFPVGAAPLAPAFESPDARSFYEFLWRNVAAASVVVHSRGAETAISAGGRFRIADVLPLPSIACWTPASECLAVRTLARRRPDITSLAASGDGRVFFVEANQRIGVIASGVLQSRPVLVADSLSIQFNHVSLDPAFAETGLMYVGETETLADSAREFRIVQYRVLRNQTGQRAVIVNIPLPSSGDALFTVSSSGHVHITVPAANDGSLVSPYAGMVLRLNVDGTVPSDQPGGSPAIATGYPNPTAIAFDERSQRLWLAGVDERNQPSIRSLGGEVSPASVAFVSLSANTDGTGGDSLFLASASGSLGKAQTGPDGTITGSWQLTIGQGSVRAIATAPSGELFVAVKGEPTIGGDTTSILRLTPAR